MWVAAHSLPKMLCRRRAAPQFCKIMLLLFWSGNAAYSHPSSYLYCLSSFGLCHSWKAILSSATFVLNCWFLPLYRFFRFFSIGRDFFKKNGKKHYSWVQGMMPSPDCLKLFSWECFGSEHTSGTGHDKYCSMFVCEKYIFLWNCRHVILPSPCTQC